MLFLDDDLILEPYVVGATRAALQEEGCGFVGRAVIGLSYVDDVRSQEQHISFWKELGPRHAGEDVLAQLRVMARYGGCGLLPSGVHHQELPTTVEDRRIDAPRVLSPLPPEWNEHEKEEESYVHARS